MRRNLRIRIPETGASVSGIIQLPGHDIRGILLLAHGAGAGMHHKFMAELADSLESHKIGTLRFQFPYMEEGKRRPDRPPVAHAAIKAAHLRALQYGRKHKAPVYAGGKSFGGRMVSQAVAQGIIAVTTGLVFFGFPLHPPARPGTERAVHLREIRVPMLFLQGTRDKLADPALIRQVTDDLKLATLHMVTGADHGFETLKSSGITSNEALEQVVIQTVHFMSG